MNAYIYNTDIYCEVCTTNIKAEIGLKYIDKNQFQRMLEDSTYYPQLCFDGGGEADTPQHCGNCQLFLENPLTTDGENYVIEAITIRGGNVNILRRWKEFYSYLWC